jgi:hypothetical protein
MNFICNFSRRDLEKYTLSLATLDISYTGIDPFKSADLLWNVLSNRIYRFFIPKTNAFNDISITTSLKTRI